MRRRTAPSSMCTRRTVLAAILVVLGCSVCTVIAQGDLFAAPSSSLWPKLVDACDVFAPFCAIICFLAPIPTMKQISRDKTVGKLPLLPYTSMFTQSFVWMLYGILKKMPNVWASNAVGVVLGTYYFVTFVRHCGPAATNLPGNVGQHTRGAGSIMLFNAGLAISGIANSIDMIGKQGVLFCVIMFASPLAALKHVIESKSAASIPLPFTVASFINCAAWSVMGIWKHGDFNIYFPNLMGLSCAVTQLLLKGYYGNRVNGTKEDLPK